MIVEGEKNRSEFCDDFLGSQKLINRKILKGILKLCTYLEALSETNTRTSIVLLAGIKNSLN